MPIGSNGAKEPARLASNGAPADASEVASTIRSVERAARILGFFTVGRPRLTLSEITARLGVSKATAHRYTTALRRVNLLRYAGAEYTLGPQVLTLAAAARAGLPIISLAGPLMEKLVSEVNETVVLSVWEGEAPIVVRIDDGTERLIRVSVRAGARLSPFDSAQGRVFCAFLSAGEVPGLKDELARSPRLADDLKTVRENGLAINAPEFHGVRTLAVPVFSDGQIMAVVAVVGTTATVPDDISSSVAKALKCTGHELTRLYGRHEDPDEEGDDDAPVRASQG
ncbi:MAG TPA: IclR family transcriptional regulator [Acidimicrobiales bacterium]|jgi:IclR family pca regulon transcriptional regulator|nr:IclR family transcriptional regulator [Acidimicrobiales bacterium]